MSAFTTFPRYRHPELVSGSISRLNQSAVAKEALRHGRSRPHAWVVAVRWMLKRVQHDGVGFGIGLVS